MQAFTLIVVNSLDLKKKISVDKDLFCGGLLLPDLVNFHMEGTEY